MPDEKFDDEWEALPEVYKTRFLEILEERGLAEEFDILPHEYKNQILGIIKEHVLGDITSPSDATLPTSKSSK